MTWTQQRNFSISFSISDARFWAWITQAIWFHTDNYIQTAKYFYFYSQKTLGILGKSTKLQLCLVLNLKIEIISFFG